jgi:acetoacetate decarboxylase
VSNLRGYGNPLSPSGEAALVEETPHHISATAIQVTYRVDPEAAAPYLPDGLRLTDDALGYAYVADMVKVSASNPDEAHLEPQRTQYTEGLVGLYCEHDGIPGRFSAFIWVSVDWSMMFGHYMGFAKKVADVWLTKIQPVNPAMGPIDAGTKLRGVVHRHGTRPMTVDVELRERVEDNGIPSYGHRVYTVRSFPSPGPGIPAVEQLLAHDLASATTQNIWRADGAVELASVQNEDLAGLRPIEIVDAYYFERGWTTVGDAKLVRDYVADGTR